MSGFFTRSLAHRTLSFPPLRVSPQTVDRIAALPRRAWQMCGSRSRGRDARRITSFYVTKAACLLLGATSQGPTQYAHLPSSSICSIITCMTTGDSLMARRASYRGHVRRSRGCHSSTRSRQCLPVCSQDPGTSCCPLHKCKRPACPSVLRFSPASPLRVHCSDVLSLRTCAFAPRVAALPLLFSFSFAFSSSGTMSPSPADSDQCVLSISKPVRPLWPYIPGGDSTVRNYGMSASFGEWDHHFRPGSCVRH